MTRAARDHALAIDAAGLIDLLRTEQVVTAEEAPELLAVARALRSLFHHEFLAVKERLQRAWTQLETRDGHASAASTDQRELAKDLQQTLRRLLVRANFVEVPLAELTEAMRQNASFGLRIDLDLGDFEDLSAWRRREIRRAVTIESLFGLRKRSREVDAYDRFCVYARFKGAERFVGKAGEGKLGVRPGGLTLQLFRDVPKHDVEALFPGVRVRMRLFDRALIGVPAAAGALHVLIFKVGASLYALLLLLLVFLGVRKEEPDLGPKAIGAVAGLAVLIAFLFRQWLRFLGRKNLLHRQLAEHLQTCTLDTGFGVLLHLLDHAEEEETIEALLAYAFLVRAGRPLPAKELDRAVETWLAERAGIEVDFEEQDALGKLLRLGLVTKDDAGALAAIAPAAALAKLDARWARLLSERR